VHNRSDVVRIYRVSAEPEEVLLRVPRSAALGDRKGETKMTSSKVGLLWRGDRRDPAMSPRAEAMLGPLFSAFTDLDVSAEPVVYADDATAEVRDQLLGLDGVLVWVNPIQDAATRLNLDAFLRAAAGH